MSTFNEKFGEGDTKDIYFIIIYQRKQKEKSSEFLFSKSNITPKNIYTNEIKEENGIYFYYKVFKFKDKIQDESHNDPHNYTIEFDIL